MQPITWYMAPLTLFTFGASFYYAHALHLGIACARDEQRRLTSPSAWHFFMRKFKWRGIGIAAGLVPWVVCGSATGWYVTKAYYFVDLVSFRDLLDEFFLFLFSRHVGMIGISYAFITLLAPHFKSPVPVAAIGTLIGFSLFIEMILLLPRTGLYRTYFVPHAILTLAGFAAFGLSWLYVRFKLDRAWFRFKD